ncbi:hypothetical protein EB796_000905 [Bugula neritina]|uniref:Uncharacterized protein n=1 Tax=Bugula neritina TaxID=10212 RepID=A0A7J7KRM2_BUGNE|nr:hypothetical protein EB796_000905 [Bugula neritina]
MSSAGDITTESESLPSCSHISSSDDENLPKNMFQHKKAPFFKSNLNDTFDRQIELKSLQAQLAQLELELSSERENTISFRKKLTQANKEKFEQAARFNEEACKLHTQNAALQAKIEQQSEFTEHLEFELDKNRKQLEKEQKAAGTRAVSNAHSIEQLEELLNDARAKISSLESQNEQNKRSMLVQVEQLKETIADRDRILRETVQEQQNVIAERNTLNEVIQQQQETIGEHRNQFTDLKIELDKVKEHLAEANARVKSLTVSEQDYREQLEVVQQNSKELSEAIEAEKTSHLESKFNSELVQLKINDLENSMQHQKVVNDGLQENVNTLSGQATGTGESV